MKFVFRAFQDRTMCLGNVSSIQRKSLDALEFVGDESLDLIYVDGDHRYEAVVADIQGWKPKLRKGGVLAGHDWSFPAVQKALSETIGQVDFKLFQGDSWAVAL
jgi:predicted O-methyltransferase YrrM